MEDFQGGTTPPPPPEPEGATTPPPSDTPPAPAPPSSGSSMGIDPNLAGLLSYLVGVICPILFIAMEKDNKYIRFHAMQALFLQISVFVLFFAFTVLSIVLGAVAPFVSCLFVPLEFVVMIGYLVVAIMMMIKAFQGEYYKLPMIGDMAEKYI